MNKKMEGVDDEEIYANLIFLQIYEESEESFSF